MLAGHAEGTDRAGAAVVAAVAVIPSVAGVGATEGRWATRLARAVGKAGRGGLPAPFGEGPKTSWRVRERKKVTRS